MIRRIFIFVYDSAALLGYIQYVKDYLIHL